MRLAVLPHVGDGVDAFGCALARAKDAGGQRAHRGVARLLREDLGVLIPVNGNADGLAQFAIAQLLLGTIDAGLAVANHRVEHVEADEVAVDIRVPIQPEALFQVFGAHLFAVLHGHQVVHAGVGALEHLQVVEALAELAALRHGFALDTGNEAVDEGHGLAAVVQQARLLVAGHAFAGIGLAAIVGVALHDVITVLDELHHHVGPGAHRPHVQRQRALGHAGLGVEGIGLPGHRRHEGHLHPVTPLRVLALDADAQQVFLGRAGASQRPLAEVQKGFVLAGLVQPFAQLGVFLLDELAVFLQAHHVLGKGAEDGRRDARGGLPLEGVYEVLGHQLARALVLELQRRAPLAKITGLHRMVAVIEVAALLVLGECRVGLEQDAGLDRHVVHALGHLVSRRVVRQGLAVLVHKAWLDHRCSRLGHQLERPLQVVITVGRLVDLVGVRRVIAPIRSRGIQMAGRRLDDRRVQRV